MTPTEPEISIVIPVYNEEPNLETLLSELVTAMDAYGRTFEVITIDDGSSDGSFAKLKALHENDARLRVFRLSRNFGQNPALYAGFSKVRGRVIVTIDADLQNPPSEIPKLIDKLAEGYDLVQGWRQARKDSLFRRAASRTINRVVSLLTKIQINDLGSGMKAYRREVIDRMIEATHHARYIPAETAWHGLEVGEVKVEHRSRAAGETKYGLFALLRVNFDMIASISSAPVHLIGILGTLSSLVGFAMALRVIYVRIMSLLGPGEADVMVYQLNTILAVFFVLGGVQMICTSILCEYVSRIYNEVQGRPYFIIDENVE